MKSELASTAPGRSWAALFSAARFTRRSRHVSLDLDADRTHPRRPAGQGSRTAVTEQGGPTPAAGTVDGVEWFELDLFAPPAAKAGSRFDDTVALPLDAPRRLDTIIAAAALRLRALPEPHDLGHRSLAYRARLQQVMGEAEQARARLAAGTYGLCLECSSPISLALLTERPWTQRCVYCALDI
jgi:hypothetical protein